MTTFQRIIYLVFFLIISVSLLAQERELNSNGNLDELAIELSKNHPEATLSVYAFNKEAEYQKILKSGKFIEGKSYNYEIGSVTKSFNALLILSLINGDYESLNEKVGIYFPAFSKSVQDITILQLLNHSSGLPANFSTFNFGKDPTAKLTDAMVNKWFKKEKISNKKVGQFKYSNVGYALLGMVLEKKFGATWSDLIESNILRKGMEKSYVYSSEKTNVSGLAGFSGKGKSVDTWAFNRYISAGGIISNVDDLKTYLGMTRQYKNVLQNEAYWNPMEGKSNFSIGWVVDKLSDEINYYWHNGQTNGFSSYIGWIEKMDLGLIILVNKSIEIDDNAITLLNALISHDNAVVK